LEPSGLGGHNDPSMADNILPLNRPLQIRGDVLIDCSRMIEQQIGCELIAILNSKPFNRRAFH